VRLQAGSLNGSTTNQNNIRSNNYNLLYIVLDETLSFGKLVDEIDLSASNVYRGKLNHLLGAGARPATWAFIFLFTVCRRLCNSLRKKKGSK
jgi:hypothetical protein